MSLFYIVWEKFDTLLTFAQLFCFDVEGGEESEKEEGEEEEEEEFPEWGIAIIALSCFIFILAGIYFWQKRRLRREQQEEEKSKDIEAQPTKVHYDGKLGTEKDKQGKI